MSEAKRQHRYVIAQLRDFTTVMQNAAAAIDNIIPSVASTINGLSNAVLQQASDLENDYLQRLKTGNGLVTQMLRDNARIEDLYSRFRGERAETAKKIEDFIESVCPTPYLGVTPDVPVITGSLFYEFFDVIDDEVINLVATDYSKIPVIEQRLFEKSLKDSHESQVWRTDDSSDKVLFELLFKQSFGSKMRLGLSFGGGSFSYQGLEIYNVLEDEQYIVQPQDFLTQVEIVKEITALLAALNIPILKRPEFWLPRAEFDKQLAALIFDTEHPPKRFVDLPSDLRKPSLLKTYSRSYNPYVEFSVLGPGDTMTVIWELGFDNGKLGYSNDQRFSRDCRPMRGQIHEDGTVAFLAIGLANRHDVVTSEPTLRSYGPLLDRIRQGRKLFYENVERQPKK